MENLRQKVLEANLHRAPSVGSVVKKLLEINSSLGAAELMDIIRQSSRPQGEAAGDFASAEVIDLERAIELVKLAKTSA